MTPWTLLRSSDAAMVLAGASLLIGWLAGVVFFLLVRRGLVAHLRAEIARLRDVVEDQDAVLAGLYAQVARLGNRLILEHAVDATRREGVTK
jgi:hypothetical protein